MQILEISQIIFNFTVSLAFLIVIVASVSVVWAAWLSASFIKKLTEDIKEKSADALGKLNFMLTGAAVVSFIAKLFKKKKSK